MKVAVLNFSGNVGKTTVAGQLLMPRMKVEKLFSIESINSGADADGIEVEKMKGKKFGELLNELMLTDDAIIDVGASNVEDFLKLMQQYDGSQEEFDYFVVPVIKDGKVQSDTVRTIAALKQLGVPKSKIRMVFNKVETDDVISKDFAAMFGLAALEKSFVINENFVIYANEAFELMKNVRKPLHDIVGDETDYRARLREVKGTDEEQTCLRMISLKRLASTVNKNLDDVFKVLFK
ncbi:StbB family protein [Undibacterium sp.]|uniref:StbB family protein n=1 Tax=Undibacterium sp. TaxID=1914977 RepID=UPI0037509C14